MKSHAEKIIHGEPCSPERAYDLATTVPEAELFTAATHIREHFFGNEIQLCSIINAKSGTCDMDCRFCSQSSYNSTVITSYPFLKQADLHQEISDTLSEQNRHCGIVTSGGKLTADDLNKLTDTVRNLQTKGPTPVCASLGRLGDLEFKQLKQAGVRRYHHNLESSKAYYPTLCSTQSWDERLATVQSAQAAGLEVCCGGLFGLGESWEDRIDLAFTLKNIGIKSVPINFLYAHDGTPLQDHPILSASEALRIIAVYRFILPDSTLRICGGRTHVLHSRQHELFAAGANGLMTGNYLTVKGSQYETDRAMIEELGLRVSPTN